MDTATKTGIDAAKTASKRVVQKTAEATGDLIGSKVANKITSLGRPKEKTKKVEEIYIPPEKRQQIINDLKLFWTYKNGISKNCKLAWHDFWWFTKVYHDLLLKNGSKFMINQEEVTMLTKNLELKHHC